MENPYIIVLVTTASRQEAETIAQHLLKEKLIACANILGPVTSHFHWFGKIERSEEFLMILKSRMDLFRKLSEAVREMHSYEVPEIIALPVAAGSMPYLDWMNDSLK